MSFPHLRACKEGDVAGVEGRNDQRSGQWQHHVGSLASEFPNWDFPNWERSMPRLYVVTLLILSYMQSISCEMLGWMKHKLKSRVPGEISITSDMQMTPPLWQKVKKN